MPEGHTIHGIARDLGPFVGRRVRATSPQGRFAEGAAVVDGRTLEAAEAHGKHLLLDFGDVHVHIHLGLAGGVFITDPANPPRPTTRLRLVADPPTTAWNLVAPNRCELYDDTQRAALLARLGADPLRDDDPSEAIQRIARSPKPIGELLLDQRIVAGIGNVYRAEALHLHGVHPDTPADRLTPDQLQQIWDTVVRLMRRGLDEGRIFTLDTPAGVDRAALDARDGRYVYKQERCRTCDGEIRTWALANRVAYACEQCQPRPRARRRRTKG